mmetsp:Transcript_19814/g.30609  ORF Transcript_19814/g.30609 Transcript_19814/m.30609 type:complete len:852 (+) Transcript_19814:124-2679(+)|eukprot:CAMPEP_0195305518 /NCGR_PEP_ID=MMETSP0707-20130614/36401_1 /TAXON_ID=33640 /ORGANISM="Asterionellopsis glacialis, Strain CCMP134" /LENGTH=851 /DNA_ID=CAMNT_0040369657 /DNA_START=113 /DNA_END=2671 /DNA_ORIENTATION=-
MTDTDRPRIVKLPKMVVDRIAAGEVVQRPSSVIKELIENCLDAGSSYVSVSIEKGGLHKMIVTDNGCGIAKDDMPLVAARFATSKLTKVEDLQSIESFGFRGEALASTSLVSRLHIVSKRSTDPTAFQCSYADGAPTGKAKPLAGKQGTIVTVSDLFYNLPHRRKTNERDEYQRILTIMQRYALHHASQGIGFVCSKRTKGSETYDLNTANVPLVKILTERKIQRRHNNSDSSTTTTMEEEESNKATRKVFAQIFGSKLENQLLLLKCESQQTAATASSDDSTTEATTIPKQNQCHYSARGFLINPSLEPPKGCSGLVLFVNDRLVESPYLKRTVDGIYAGFTKSKPIAYLTIKVPGNQVDVNVHPTKRQVALLYEEEIFEDLAKSIKELLSSSVRSFAPSSLLPKPSNVSPSLAGKKRPTSSDGVTPPLTPGVPPSAKKRPVDPTKFVRTTKSAMKGALEPFLVQTKDQGTPPYSGTPNVMTPSTDGSSPAVDHEPTCALRFTSRDAMDLSVPGAFANVVCNCPVGGGGLGNDRATVIRSRRQMMVRPKKVVPTPCTYKSIQSMRSRVAKESDKELVKRLRESMLVGVLSQRRILVQCGAELLVWNHFEMARELFYQLALARFGGGANIGMLGTNGGINVKSAIEQALQLEESIATAAAHSRPCSPSVGTLKVSEINSRLAEQATSCLFDNFEMLEEYFSMRLSRKTTESPVMLEALPVLLEGYSPQPYALPLFLLRLATEVDWMDEQPCFEGVCRELGSYYAHTPLVRRTVSLPSNDNKKQGSINRNNGGTDDGSAALPSLDLEADQFVRHALFPAISYLLVPPKKFAETGIVSELALLSSLYKVFERC